MNNDPIMFWNAVAQEVHRLDFSFFPEVGPQQGGPTRASRALAIVHVAMYDAWNGAQATGNSYLISQGAVLPQLPPGAAAETAVAGAAASTLRALFSHQAAYIEGQMQDFMAHALPSGLSIQEMSDGIEYGRQVALKVLALRNNDGSELADSVYIAGSAPGNHRTAPNDPLQGYLGPRWGDVKPFCISFVPTAGDPQGLDPYIDPPPGFTTPRYKKDFEEVRDYGGENRNKRSAKQEATGIYWAYDGAKELGTPPRLYNQVVRKIIEDMSPMPSTGDLARLFALVHAGMADAGIVSWRAKYHYAIWRPAVGVREDDAGTGPTGLGTGSGAKGDPFWWPYGAPLSNQPGPGRRNFTPHFPAYPSGHATFGTTVFELVRRFFNVTNNSLKFNFVSDELDGRTRDVDGTVRTRISREYTLDKAIKDNLESRVWLGVHWRFDGDGGKQAGEEVAQRVFAGPCFP